MGEGECETGSLQLKEKAQRVKSTLFRVISLSLSQSLTADGRLFSPSRQFAKEGKRNGHTTHKEGSFSRGSLVRGACLFVIAAGVYDSDCPGDTCWCWDGSGKTC